jgi:hypothetical protein
MNRLRNKQLVDVGDFVQKSKTNGDFNTCIDDILFW